MTGDVIAQRPDRKANGAQIVVQFTKPRPNGEDRACDFRLSGAFKKQKAVYCADPVRALYLGLQHAAPELSTHAPAVHWFEPGDDLGLPAIDSTTDLKSARKKPERS